MIDVRQQEKNLKIVVVPYKTKKREINIIIDIPIVMANFFLEFKNLFI